MMRAAARVFITGTDTGVGKTRVACALTRGLRAMGRRVMAIKPIAAGAELMGDPSAEQQWLNDDALALCAALADEQPYQRVNPIVLRAAVAPHLAALAEGIDLDVASVLAACQNSLAVPSDYVLIEGAGGWLVPLNDREMFADLALCLTDKIVLVVDMRLGCLNHAMLTAEAIRRRGGRLIGWIANQCQEQPMAHALGNEHYLQKHLGAPLLAHFAHGPGSPEQDLALAEALKLALADEGI